MKTTLSPRELASAVGVSESSVKRWVDEGRLKASRTAGGHRRIALADALRFVRQTGLSLVRPELLGLPDLARVPAMESRAGSPEAALRDALLAGRAAEAVAIVLSGWLGNRSVAELCDGPVCAALRDVGVLWRHSDEGIFIEHRASEICTHALQTLRALLPPRPQRAPVAVGAAPSGDIHAVPSLMAATVLAAEGYQEVNLAAETPLHVLGDAAAQHRARLVWLAFTVDRDEAETAALVRQTRRLARRVGDEGGHVVIGGRALPREALDGNGLHLRAAGSFAELADTARALLDGNAGADEPRQR